MNIRRANQKGNDRIYTCSRYNKYGVAHCSQHRIKYDTLYDIVLEQIRACAKKALSDEQEVAAALNDGFTDEERAEREAIENSIAADGERITALERIISRVYEDMIAGRITEENFNRILANSQAEQATLKNRVELAKERLAQRDQEQKDNSRWLELIRDYADIRELDTVTLNRLIQKIVVYEDMDGDTARQTVEIHFNFNNQTDKRRLVR